jgi:CARDB
MSNLAINPSEPWPGDSITISAQLTNTGKTGSTNIDLQINGVTVDNKTIQVQAGESAKTEFTLTEASTGTYTVRVGTLTGSFTVVPAGKHTLTVNTAYSGLAFTIDGQTQTTPFSVLLNVGTTHTVTMPAAVTTYTFQRWDDGNMDPSKTITITGPTQLYAYFSGATGRGSCPSLYLWNGTAYTYASELSDGPGWLGFVNHYNPDGTITFAYSNPWSYIKLDTEQLQQVNGNYKMLITEDSEEIFYLDSVKLIAVDHPSNVDVYSTRATYLYNLSGHGTIYTVNWEPSTPISAVNNGEDVLAQISKQDGNYTVAQRWAWNTLDLDLGNLTGAQQINLIVTAVIAWPTNQAGGDWASQFATQPGVTPSPPPYMEVKDKNGNWIPVPNDRQFPMPPVNPNSFVVNLTDLFPTNNYALRLRYYQDISFDYIGVDTTQPQPIQITTVTTTSANFNQLYITNSSSTGNFTRYGNVAELLLYPDDMYVIGRQGDTISIEFPVDPTLVASGMTRDYFIVASAWFKGNGLPYLPFTVDPLPFQNMSSFPYPQTETFPADAQHESYLVDYNSRNIAEENSS